MLIAHTQPTSAGLTQAIGSFGADWLSVLVPVAALLVIGGLLVRRGRQEGARSPLAAFGRGAAAVSGLPPWAAAGLMLLGAALLIAVLGFFWDVAWHIALGRDEFLFSPPHTMLAVGIGLIGVAGLVSTVLATSSGDEIGWRVGRWRVPRGAAVLLAASGTASAGFLVDELWHWAYGLDVTMWSPPHLSMISAAAFTPMAAWLLVGEAGPPRRRGVIPHLVRGLPVSATLIGLSAWQLEYDMGVPQWQQAFHPLLVVLAAGLALTAARMALGPGGALRAALGFVLVRAGLALLTTGVWDLVEPRFLPYVVSATAVELAFVVTRGRSVLVRGLAAGAGVATLGVAGEWAATQVWTWIPWTGGLMWRSAPLLLPAGLAAGMLGAAFGRLVRREPSGITAPVVALSLTAVLLTLGLALPRVAPEGSATVTTMPAGADRVLVEVEVQPAELVADPDRYGVLAWQGGHLAWVPLRPVGPGRAITTEAVPVGGHWKTMVRLAEGRWLAAVPIALPADPEIGAPAVPLERRRSGPLLPEQHLLLREAHDGPAWPGLIGYGFTGTALAVVVGLLVAGAAALAPRPVGQTPRAAVAAAAGKGART